MTVSPCVSKSADKARVNSLDRRSRKPCGRPLFSGWFSLEKRVAGLGFGFAVAADGFQIIT
jgi:hypothetical protein